MRDRFVGDIGEYLAGLRQARRTGDRVQDLVLADAEVTGDVLRFEDLHDAVFRTVDMTGVDLRGAKLIRWQTSDVNLTGADLSDADLTSAHLTGAPEVGWTNLTGANLARAWCVNVRLFKADLTGADLTEAYLMCAVLIGAVLRDATLVRTTLVHADLGDADLTGADLRGADLTGAVLPGAPAGTWSDLDGGRTNGFTLAAEDLRLSALSGVRWDESTNWPGSELRSRITAHSDHLPDGTFRVRPGTVGPGA